MAGLYLHIPFCRKACHYCNFHFSTILRGKEDLLDAMAGELALRAPELKGAPIQTIYLGGGTPSLLSIAELSALFDAAAKHYDLSQLGEVTLEANPDDLSHAYLQELRRTPVNRLSIGVQAFDEKLLRYMNRAHNANQSMGALQAAQDAGFNNMSIDLIYGVPGLSDAAWQQSLEAVSSMGIPHLSAYALTVEEGTALHHFVTKGKSPAVDEDSAARHFEMLGHWAQDAGYEHYEISNLARPGFVAQHNTSYWQGAQYIGIGPSAHSFDGKGRSWNVANNALYTSAIRRGERMHESEALSEADRLNEYLMTSLRTAWGTDLNKVKQDFGTAQVLRILAAAQPFIVDQKLLSTDQILRLTPAGRLFADAIAAALFR